MRRYPFIHGYYWIFVVIAAFAGITSCGTDSSVQNEVPEAEWELDAEYNLAIPEPSGLTWDSVRECLWTVSDRTGEVSRISTTGQVLETLPWTGEDPEGIAMDASSGLLYIVEEQLGQIVVIDTAGTELARHQLFSVGATTNAGLEAIALALDHQTLTVLREPNPTVMVVVDTSGVEQTRRVLDIADDYSGAARDQEGRLWVISDESKAAYAINEYGTVINTFDTDLKKGEGIAAVGTTTLYIVSDSEQTLYKFVLR